MPDYGQIAQIIPHPESGGVGPIVCMEGYMGHVNISRLEALRYCSTLIM